MADITAVDSDVLEELLMDWEATYRRRRTDPATAVQSVHSGQRVYIGGGAGVPCRLVEALTDRGPQLRSVEIVHVLTLGAAPYAEPPLADAFRVNALFIGPNVRTAVADGRADFTPVSLGRIPALFRDGTLPIDVALISLSPPDEHGFCSYGVEVGTTKPAAARARLVIAEVNAQMPRTMGDSFIHVNELAHIVEVDTPLPELVPRRSTAAHLEIGRHVAALIPDGATLQMGIGSIPNAVLSQLGHHRDLGIHTELFSDGLIDLVESGVVNCRRKSMHPGKIVAGFLLGTERLYDFVDDNPLIELHPTDYVNDPFNIARNDDMVAINSAVEIDLTGQVCADSIGTRLYSGAGGQVDFMRGAARSRGGHPIVALLSTAAQGAISRIVPMLKPGAGVVTTRSDVHFVVTEFGVASLHGRTIRERANALIDIAHPAFRESLTAAACELHYL